MQRIFLSLCILSIVLFPKFALASSDTVLVDVDPYCHTQSECIAARSNSMPTATEEEIAAGFVPNPTACADYSSGNSDAESGYCLAGNTINTSVSIAGRTSFSSIGDFIQYIYRISFTIAAAIAVVILIVSGLQWMTSSGNGDAISSAKKRIFGSITGIVLLATSYILLEQINPALVNLRQPEVYMIRGDQLEFDVEQSVLCDPEEPEESNACSDTQFCARIETGLSMSPCETAAFVAIATPVIVMGATQAIIASGGAALTTGEAVSAAFSAVVRAMLGRGIGIGKAIALPRNLRAAGALSQAFSGGVIQGVYHSGRILVRNVLVGGATYTLYQAESELGIARSAVNDFFEEELKGVCVDRPIGHYRPGMLCNAAIPNVCGSYQGRDMRCIADSVINSQIGCWVSGGSNIGFCSDGGLSAACETNADCQSGFLCIDFDLPGSVLDGKSCSDGTEGAYCEDDDQCATGSCINNLCTSFKAEHEFDGCQASPNCGQIDTRFFRDTYACFTVDSACRINKTDNDAGDSLGLCLQEGGFDNFWGTATAYYTDKQGREYFRYPSANNASGPVVVSQDRSLVWVMLQRMQDANISVTIDLGSCASTHNGGAAISDRAAYLTQLIEGWGHRVVQ